MAYSQKRPAEAKKLRVVGAPLIKRDAKALVTGKPVYTDDLAMKDCLIVKVLRSPYAHALIREIDCGVAPRYRESNVSSLGRMCRRSALPWQDRPIRSPAPMTV